MLKNFCTYHLLQLLEEYDKGTLPLDVAMHHYFNSNHSLGSKDRAFVAEHAYGLMRWKGLLDAFGPATWESRLALYPKRETLDKKKLPLHLQVSFPEELFVLIKKTWGEEKAKEICLTSNLEAPTTIRINPLKTTREALLNKLSLPCQKCEHSPYGIVFAKREALFALPEFREGLFEMQDEGSQLLADLVACKPGDLVLDYCSGSGGKTLAFAHKTEGKGQIYLHDVRERALLEAKKRLKRAGIQNSQIIQAEAKHLASLKKKMDWVLVDAPCSGTGTLRRNPDMKWRFKADDLKTRIGEQRNIFEKALSFVKEGGSIVYATCSLLSEENEEQKAHFLKSYPLKESATFQSIPEPGKMDGFYGVVFCRMPSK